MTSPRPLRNDRGTTRRTLVWALVALVFIGSVVLYFRFGHQPVPLIGQVR